MAVSSQNYQVRTGEAVSDEFDRSGRFFRLKGQWFFKTREGLDYGPYLSRTECKYAYDEFIDVVSNRNDLGGIPVDFQDSSTEWKMPKINFN